MRIMFDAAATSTIRPDQVSGGPETGLIENLLSGRAAGAATDLLTSEGMLFEEAREERRKTIERVTGKPFGDAVAPFMPAYEEPSPSAAFQWEAPPDREEVAIDQLRSSLPADKQGELLRRDGLERRAREMAAERDAENAEIASRANGFGIAGQFLGAAAAQFQDPLVLATLPFGAASSARTVVAAGIEGALAAGVTLAQQPAVQKWRAEVGLDAGWEQAAQNVALAGGLGAGATLAIRGLVGGLRALSDRKLVEASRELNPNADPETSAALTRMEMERDFEDANPFQPEAMTARSEHAKRAAETLVALDQRGTPAELPPVPPELAMPPADALGEPARKGAPGDTVYRFDPDELTVDAPRLQFKAEGDAEGVTDRLQGVTQWDATQSGVVFVWEDAAGTRFIADGHQRLALARRIKAADPTQAPKLTGYLFREADGWSVERMRASAAAKNIAEGTGTALDAAKVLRSAPHINLTLPPNSPLVRDGRGLARLSDDAFGMAVNRLVPDRYAALVGRLAPDLPETHAPGLKALIDADPANLIEAESVVRDVLSAPTVKAVQTDLFGTSETTQVLYKERAIILSGTLRFIRRDRAAFGSLLRNEARLVETGNILARDANAARAQDDAEILAFLQRAARQRGPIADALARAAEALHGGARYDRVVAEFVDDVRRGADGVLPARGRRSGGGPGDEGADDGGGGGSPRQGGDEGLDAGARALDDDPPLLAPGGRGAAISEPIEDFSDPTLKAVADETDALEADLRRRIAEGGDFEVDLDDTLFKIVPERPIDPDEAEVGFAPVAAPEAVPRDRLSVEVAAAVDDALRILPSNLQVRVEPSIRRRGGDGALYELEGYYSPREALVALAADADSPGLIVRHEAIHALREANILTPQHWDVLRNEALAKGWLEEFGIEKRYRAAYSNKRTTAEELEDLLIEEAIAEAFEQFAKGREFRSPVAAVFEYLKRLVDAVRRTLSGRGMSAEDIFHTIEAGRLPGQGGDVATPQGAMLDVMLRDDTLFAIRKSSDVLGELDADKAFAEALEKSGGSREAIEQGMRDGTLEPGRALKAKRLLDEVEAEYLDAMGPTGAAIRARQETVSQTKREAAEKRRQRLLQIDAQTRLAQKMELAKRQHGLTDKSELALYTVDSTGARGIGYRGAQQEYQAVRGLLHGGLDQAIASFRRTIVGETRNKATQLNMLREAFGEKTGDAEAAAMAKAWLETADRARQMFNAAGGHIGKLERWGMPQSHDTLKVRQASYDEWRDFILPKLDRARMIDQTTGRPFSDARLELVLREVHETIRTDGFSKITPSGAGGGRAIGNRHADHRFLHFRSADDWHAYAQRFGSDDIFSSMMAHLDGMARDIGAMRALGPNPQATIRFLQQTLRKDASVLGADKAGEASRNRLEARAAHLQVMFDTFTGAVNAPVNGRVSRTLAATRSFLTAAQLGSAALSALTDLNFQRMAARHAGLPQARVMKRMLSLLDPTNQEDKRLAIRLGLIAEEWSQMASAQLRYVGEVSGNELSRRLADGVLRLSGLSAWTQAGRWAFGMEFMGTLAEQAGKSFDALPVPLRKTLDAYGIGGDAWDAIRRTPLYAPDKGGFLRPDDIAARTDLGPALADDLATRVLAMIQSETEFAVPSATVRGRAAIGGATRPGTVAGELLRSTLMYKNFAVTLYYTHLRRMAEQEGLYSKARYATQLVVGTTLMGALAMQLKGVSIGRDPEPMFGEHAKEFWPRALLQGGGLGLFGDFLIADQNRFGHGLEQSIAGPVVNFGNDALKLTVGNLQQAAKGEDTDLGAEAVQFGKRYLPGGSLWYARLGLERLVFDNIQRAIDPEHKKRWRAAEQRQERELNTQFYWPRGSRTAERWPDLGQAFEGGRP